MQKLYKGWFWVTILAIGFLVGCTYAGAKDEQKTPNLGILKHISWESHPDPNSNDGYIQEHIVRDVERNKDYIIVQISGSGRPSIAITERK